jgi:hypothetical protein
MTAEEFWKPHRTFRTVPSANTLVRWVYENAFAFRKPLSS